MSPVEDIDENTLKQAVALFYDGSAAPTITAKGEGQVAEDIIALALESGVPLCDNAPLVDLLSKMSLGDTIPEELYVVVAHVIAFAYKVRMELALPQQNNDLNNPG